jgi:hypothetical protein
MAMTTMRSSRPGLTATQLIVLLALLLLLLALLAPLMGRLRVMSRRSESSNNLRQLGIASISFADAFAGRLPPAVGSTPNNADRVGTCHFFILPYLEQGPLFQKAGGFNGTPWENDVAATSVKLFVDPQDASAPPHFLYRGWLATTSYACNWLVFKDGNQRFPASIPDGTSNTLMFAQRYQMCNGNPTAWGYAALYYWAPTFAYYNTDKFQSTPADGECDPTRPQAIGESSILTGFCDGSARPIRAQVRAQTWYFLCDPADGGVIADDAF